MSLEPEKKPVFQDIKIPKAEDFSDDPMYADFEILKSEAGTKVATSEKADGICLIVLPDVDARVVHRRLTQPNAKPVPVCKSALKCEINTSDGILYVYVKGTNIFITKSKLQP